jgi:hydroxymethylpyrimidine pyrophosphatase-like HAD family hydrolase
MPFAGLVALDIDGTVVLEDESPSPGVQAAVATAVDAGWEVTLATGRSWEGTRDVLRMLGLQPEYVVCSNGAVLMRRVGGDYERFRVETFDATEVLERLMAALPDAHYMVELADGGRRYTDSLGGWNLARAVRVPFAELAAEPVCRVVVVQPGEGEDFFAGIAERIGLHHVSYAIGWTAWLDIAPTGVDKGVALERVRALLDLDAGSMIAVGDGRNDLGMFAWARDGGGRAVAMGQAPPEVKDAASELTASVADGGVADILLGLERGRSASSKPSLAQSRGSAVD